MENLSKSQLFRLTIAPAKRRTELSKVFYIYFFYDSLKVQYMKTKFLLILNLLRTVRIIKSQSQVIYFELIN